MPLSVCRNLKPRLRLCARHLARSSAIPRLVLTCVGLGKNPSRFGQRGIVRRDALAQLFHCTVNAADRLIQRCFASEKPLEQCLRLGNFS